MLIRCPNSACLNAREVPDDLAGKLVKCPACGGRFVARPASGSSGGDSEHKARHPLDSALEKVQKTGLSLPSEVVDAGQTKLFPETVVLEREELEEDPLIGMELGGCILKTKLGQGGMGAVYKARHVGLDIDVAVKVVPQYLVRRSPQFVERFQREARAAARLDHPNIVKVHNVGQEKGYHFMVMEYVEGESLRQRLDREGRLDIETALSILQQILQALISAHGKGIVHRDIKPDNILLKEIPREEGALISHDSQLDFGKPRDTLLVAKLADLGLAKVTDTESQGFTLSGFMLGTVDYMAPEQAEDAKNVDQRVDIYSLGCTLYAMLTGKKPFPGTSVMQVMLKHVSEPFPDIRQEQPDLPAELGQMLLKMAAKKPKDRYQSAADVMDALGSLTATITAELMAVSPETDAAELGTLCPKCGRPFQPEAKWCSNCGTALFEQCRRCGGNVRAGSAFCIHCGSNLAEETTIVDGLEVAKGLLEEKHVGDALVAIEKILEKDPERTEAQKILDQTQDILDRIEDLKAAAAAAEEAGEFDLARRTLEEALDLYPGEPSLRTALDALPGKVRQSDIRKRLDEAGSALDDKRPSAALALYHEVLAIDPENERATEGLRSCNEVLEALADRKAELQGLLQGGERQQARAVCEAILELDREDPEAEEALESLKEDMAQLSEAISKANNLMRGKKWGQAVEAWRHVLRLRSEHPEAKSKLAEALRAREEFARLADAARSLMEKDPSRAEQALLDALKAGDWLEGVRLLQGVRVRRQSIDNRLQKAQAQAEKKDWDVAIESFEAVLKECPNHEAAQRGLHQAREARQVFQDFAQEALRLTELRSLAEAERTLLKAHGLGYWPESRPLLEQVQTDLARVGALYRQARDLVEKSEWAEALQRLEETSRLWPTHPGCRHLYGYVSGQGEVLRPYIEKAEAFLAKSRATSAVQALNRALSAGDSPEGEALLRVARERVAASRDALALGEAAAGERKWRGAYQYFEKARSLDEESIPSERMSQVGALAGQIAKHAELLRSLAEEERFEELIKRAGEADSIGVDDDIESLRQLAKKRLDEKWRKELEGILPPPPRPAVSPAEPRPVRKPPPPPGEPEPPRPELTEQEKKARQRLEDAKDLAARKQWQQAMDTAEQALEFDFRLDEARTVIQRAKRAIAWQSWWKRAAQVAAGLVVLALFAGSVLTYRAIRSGRIVETAGWFDAQMTAARTKASEADSLLAGADQELRTGREQGKSESVSRAQSDYQAAEKAYASLLTALEEAGQRARSAPLDTQRREDAERAARDVSDKRARAAREIEASQKLLQALAKFAEEVSEARRRVAERDLQRGVSAYSRALAVGNEAALPDAVILPVRAECKKAGEQYFREIVEAGQGRLKVGLAKLEEAKGQHAGVAKALGEARDSLEELTRTLTQALEMGHKMAIEAAILSEGEALLSKAQDAQRQVAASLTRNDYGRFMVAGSDAVAAENYDAAIKAFADAEAAAEKSDVDPAAARKQRQKAEKLKEGTEAFRKLMEDARNLAGQAKWEEAAAAYDKAVLLANQRELPEKHATEAGASGHLAAYEGRKAAASKYEDQEDWDRAIAGYEEAAKFAEDSGLEARLASEARAKITEIRKRFGQLKYDDQFRKAEALATQGDDELKKGALAEAANSFRAAATAYREAETLARDEKLPDEQTKASALVRQAETKEKSAELGSQMRAAEDEERKAGEQLANRAYGEAARLYQSAVSLYTKAKSYSEENELADKVAEVTAAADGARRKQHGAEVEIELEKARVFEAKADEKAEEGRFAEAGKLFAEAQTLYVAAAEVAGQNGVAEKQTEANKKAEESLLKQHGSEFEGMMQHAEGLAKQADQRAEAKSWSEAATLYVDAGEQYAKAEDYARKMKLSDEMASRAAQAAGRAKKDKCVQDFELSMAKALEQGKAAKWSEAKTGYAKTKDIAEKGNLEKERLDLATEKLAHAAAMESADEQGQMLMNEGSAFLKEKKYPEAIAAYQTARGIAQNKLKDPERVKKTEDQIRGVRVAQIDDLVAQAQGHEKGERWAQGQEAYLKAKTVAMEQPVLTDRVEELVKEMEELRVAEGRTRFGRAFKAGGESEAKGQFYEAFQSFSVSRKVAVEFGFPEEQGQARMGLEKVARKAVDHSKQLAQESQKTREYQKALDAYAVAETVAKDAPLSEDTQAEIAALKKRCGELKTGWEAHEVARKTAEELLAQEKWKEAGERYQAAGKAAEDSRLEPEVLQAAKEMAQSSAAMHETETKVREQLARADDQEKAGRPEEALAACQQASGVLEKSRPLGEKTAFKGALTRVNVTVNDRIGALQRKIAKAACDDLLAKARQHQADLDWQQTLTALAEARKKAEEAGIAPEAVAQIQKEAENAGKMLEATRTFEAHVKEGTASEQKQDWESARGSYQRAIEVAAKTPLADKFRQNAEKSFAGSYDRQFDALLQAAADNEQAEKWLEAMKRYEEAKPISQKASQAEEKSKVLTTRLDAILPKVRNSLVYTHGEFDADEAVKRQAETAMALSLEARWGVELRPGVKMAFRIIPAGDFLMGSEETEKGRDDDESVRGKGKTQVRITKPYYLGETEVTQVQWRTVMGNDPSYFRVLKVGDKETPLDDHPVESVSWVDCQEFLDKLGEMLKRKCRFPTEAEWEAACRAGMPRQYWFGDKPAEVKKMDPFMWFSHNADKETRLDEWRDPANPDKRGGRKAKVQHSPVGTNIDSFSGKKSPRKPNPFGLHDMHGNVFEWCRDWYDKDYFLLLAKPDDPYLDQVAKPKERSVRGGAAGSNFWYCRSAEREANDPNEGHPDVGLRVLVEIDF
jgi:serine/threonine protein kinase/formylglycine-generating enzyme required for sulfatase activity